MTRRTVLLLVLGATLGVAAIVVTRRAAASPDPAMEEPELWTDSLMSWLDNLTQDAAQNERRYRPDVEAAESRYAIPEGLLARLLYQESRYRTDIITGATKSPVGAAGIAQFMPATAAEYGVDPLDPPQAIDGAGRYLRKLYNQFGDWRLALAAYNAGPGNVRKHGGIPPFPETQAYVADIAADVGLA